MANIIIRPEWQLPESSVTPEQVFIKRRRFLKNIGFLSVGLAGACLTGCSRSEPQLSADATPSIDTNSIARAPSGALYPAKPNAEFGANWKLSQEKITGKYNNFYEFSTTKDRVHKMVDKFQINPWPIQIGGLVEKPLNLDLEDLIAMFPLEERVYRLRCVEAWAMVVPWTGFPLRKLIEKVQPKPEAKFVRFQSFYRPTQAPGQEDTTYPWPYTEGLRLDEAMNDLPLITTGIYGKPLPKQNGAPIRIVVPWKYGYKSIKSVVKIDLVDSQPRTLWETLAPDEYPFESNVNPAVPHPRWSQSTERMIDTGNRVNTQIYNGYGKFVANLYGRA
jgi:sulfoxide reductase catalytic subunit YedY